MNKTDFCNALSSVSNLSVAESLKVINIFEDNFFLSKNSKSKIITDLIYQLKIDEDTALSYYDLAIKIIKTELKRTLKHPFKSKD